MATRGWGRIINISSESGSQPDSVAIEYASAKGALNLFSKGLSKAYADQGVLVNVVSPVYVVPFHSNLRERGGAALKRGLTLCPSLCVDGKRTPEPR
jgi:NAD(P)-dependent dehydrogenase (short-subunit alcohol dehydrogenase family)